MLYSRNQDTVAPGTQQSKVVRLGAAAYKDDPVGWSVKQAPDRRTGVFGPLPRSTTPTVNRGRITATGEHRGHGRRCFGP